ncbi:MAG: XdhC/CoxI family protein [Aeromicrobium sp.]
MRDVMDDLVGWWRMDEPVALASVVTTFDSAPRQPGATMLVGPGGAVVGSLSGGCVESDVYAVAEEVLATGRPALRHYGVSDELAMTVGLTCGGRIEVHVERIDRRGFPELEAVVDDMKNGRPIAVATVIEHPTRAGRRTIVRPGAVTAGGPTSDRLDEAIAEDAQGLLALGHHGVLTYGLEGERRGSGTRVFVSVFTPPPRMIVFGSTDFASACASTGAALGYRVTVCDARATFATPARFASAAEVVVEWPHRYLAAESAAGRIDARTVICVLTHDPKFDTPLLELALTLPEVAYVGAMGSRRVHADRVATLTAAGLTAAQIDRLSSPIGLDLGARTPEETAVSIAAEIIARREGGTGERLTTRTGRIHGRRTHD